MLPVPGRKCPCRRVARGVSPSPDTSACGTACSPLSAGIVSTLAGDGNEGHRDGAGAQARFCYPYGVAVDGGGTVLVTDMLGCRVRVVTPDGATATLAGGATSPDAPFGRGHANGQAAAALFLFPYGVAVDAAGNALVADGGNHRIRRIAAGLPPPASLLEHRRRQRHGRHSRAVRRAVLALMLVR